MRALGLIVAASLPLAACGGDESTGNATADNVVDQLANAPIIVNDPTSIDAATAEDANIAAETRFEMNDALNAGGNDSAADQDTGDNSD